MELNVVDTETADKEGGVVDIAIVTINEQFEVVRSMESLIDPERPISFSAMGIHHITQEMVHTAPTFAEFNDLYNFPLAGPGRHYIAHNAKFDLGKVLKDQLAPDHIATCSLRLVRNLWTEGEVEDFKLQTLRYQLGLEAGPAHRAMGDVITLVSLLRYLYKTYGFSLEEIVRRGRQPLSLETKMPFGKHAKDGLRLRELPSSYVAWMRKQGDMDPDIMEALNGAH